jgi:hypothetical protein
MSNRYCYLLASGNEMELQFHLPPISLGKEGRSVPEMIWTLKVHKNISSCQESKLDSSVVQYKA